MARIELIEVQKSWGEVTAVEPTSLTIDDGEFVAILGPSGCGKSTTLFMLAGIYAPTSGEIRFDGAVVNDVEARYRNVGIVFQSYALYPHLTAAKNIAFPLKFRGITGADAARRVREAAALVHVEDLLERMPSQMSGGQQQRVALARALIKEPQLLLLDEPLSNLDATLRLTMRSEIRRLQQELKVTTVLVTHDQLEATTMADRVICMSKGRVEQIGTADDLYLRPNSLFVAKFIGAPPINLVKARGDGARITVGQGQMAKAGVRGEVWLGIRPEALTIEASGTDENLPARVLDSEPMGRETQYTADTPWGALRVLDPGSERRFAVGDQVHLAVRRDSLLLFDAATERLLDGKPAAEAA
ncbi:MAG: ABC transporter ATP-binding protein [Geminicoccaceae bacterium]